MNRILIFLVMFIKISVAQNIIIYGKINIKESYPPYEICLNNKKTCLPVKSNNYSIELTDTGYVSIELYSKNKLIYQGSININHDEDSIHKDISDLEIELNEVTICLIKQKVNIEPLKSYSRERLISTGCTNITESINAINGITTRLNCGVCNSTEIQINNLPGIYTGISIDGIPIVGPLANSYAISGIPNSLIKSIEINKGPGNLKLGNEGIAGNINIKTREYIDYAKTEFQLQSNSLGENSISSGFKFKLGKSEQLLISDNSFSNRKMDVNKDGFTDFSLYKKSSTYHKLTYNKKEIVLKIFNRYLFEDRWGGQLNWKNSDKGKDNWYGETVKTIRTENNLILKRFITNGSFCLIASHSFHKQDAFYGTNSYYAQQRIMFTQAIFYKESRWVKLNTSIDYKSIQNKERSNVLASSIKEDINSIQNTGIVLQNNIIPWKKLNALADFRIDYNSINHWLPSCRLGISYLIKENIKAQIYGGNAFRQLQLISEEHAALNGSRKIEILSKSLAEKSNSIAMSFQSEISKKNTAYEIEVGGFYNSFRNKIMQDFETDPSKLIIKTINGNYVNQGLYFNVESNYNNRLKNEFGLTYSEITINETDNSGVSRSIKPLFNPRFAMNFSITYSILNKRVDLNLNGVIKSPMNLPLAERDFRPDKSPWYCLANFVISKSIKQNLGIKIGVNNLLNFIPKNPILRWEDPFNKITLAPDKDFTFDAAYNYAPIKGTHIFISIKYALN